MSNWLLSIVVLCYSGTAVDQALRGQYAWAAMWGAYAVALVAWMVATR